MVEKSRNLASGTRRLTIITFVPQSISQFRRSVVSNSATPWTAAPQASLSITNSQSLLKLRSIESVMPSNHFILCRPLPTFNLSRHQGLSSESVLELQLQHQSFQWIFRTDFLEDLLALSPCFPKDSQESSTSTVQKHQFFGAQISLWSNSHIHTWLLEKP